MIIPDLGLSFKCASITTLPNTTSHFGYVAQYSIYQQNTILPNCGISMPPSFTSFIPTHSYTPFPKTFCLRNATQTCDPQFGANSSHTDITTKESCFDDFDFEDDPELVRRRKIGMANKGKVPWNKGRKHSAETRERIRQRTIEALRDPKVKKKMSECPRAHSNQTKARIRSSLRRLWDERLKERRAGEKLFLSWASSIAEAAKIGGSDEEELDWNSYEKIKSEIAFEQRQWAADKVSAKEMVRIRSQRKAQSKAEKMMKLAEKREVQEKAKSKGERKRTTHKKSKEEIEDLVVAQELKLKERLTKMHRRKSTTARDQWSELDPKVLLQPDTIDERRRTASRGHNLPAGMINKSFQSTKRLFQAGTTTDDVLID
ncbi:IENR2 domain-containing protein [Heracleum sosnowskyi]|uniref:IENR2 domain-containing protein n=1 Tax=Heracleum sosnowskyi TaxID=360622 RepID=A0AAD8N559_9APIA|nr:IENR2 domain-containing protein [Heracleum sosnowskyi]